MPLVICAFGGGTKEILREPKNMFEKDDLCEKICDRNAENYFDGQ